ncbi:MAG: YHYH protein [Cytophagaceae bacterium]|nr:YHYH protein [Cytophagaceae bacterium]
MNRSPFLRFGLSLGLVVLYLACSKSDDDPTPTTTTTTTSTDVPVVYKKLYGASNVYVEGDYIVVRTTNVPDHKSPYFKGTKWESTQYEAYNGTGTFAANPNTITQQNLVFRLPRTPKEATTKQETPLGPIGVSINGVVFFNQYAAGRSALTMEILGFDQYGGHPQQQGQYHYHVEPTYLTKKVGKDALLGFLLDGFPVYGPQENGKTITNTDLDKYHGHVGKTADYPDGIYHYHITDADPYLNGSGFYGTPGTVSQ